MPGRKRLTIISAASFLAVALLTQAKTPLYDGIAFPDEPYRYVVPPPSSKAVAPPTNTQATSAVGNGTNEAVLAPTTQEQGPQVQLVIYEKTLRLPVSLSSVTVSVTAEATSGSSADSRPVGNAYKVVIDNSPNASYLEGVKNGLIALRLPEGYPPYPTMEYKPLGSNTWQKLATQRRGNDIYQGALKSFGEYELVQLKKPSATASKVSKPLKYIIAVGALISATSYSIWRLKRLNRRPTRGKK